MGKAIRKIFTLILLILTLVSLISCGNGLSDSKLNKILKENGYTPNDAKVVSVIDCTSDIQELESGDNKFVLMSDNSSYTFGIINLDTEHTTDIMFQFTPLNVVMQGIWAKDKDTNIKCFNLAFEYIKKYGITVFEDRTHAEEYLRELTKNNNVINTNEAQEIINNSLMQIFPNITSSDDVTVFYEDNSAVPLYYATESSEMVYNWNGIFAESVYKVWETTTDRQTQSTMQAIYGPPYVLQECVAVVDSNLKEVGTFNSMEDAKAKLKGKTTSSNNTNSTSTSSSGNTTSSNTEASKNSNTNNKTTQPVTNPSYEIYYDKDYNFQCSYPTHFSVYDDGVTSTRYSVQSEDGRVQERICVKSQDGTTVESELNNFISSHSGEITYKTSGSDYYAASVYDGTIEYYRFCKFQNGKMYWFDFDHPYSERDIYSKYIDKIYESFHITE